MGNSLTNLTGNSRSKHQAPVLLESHRRRRQTFLKQVRKEEGNFHIGDIKIDARKKWGMDSFMCVPVHMWGKDNIEKM